MGTKSTAIPPSRTERLAALEQLPHAEREAALAAEETRRRELHDELVVRWHSDLTPARTAWARGDYPEAVQILVRAWRALEADMLRLVGFDPTGGAVQVAQFIVAGLYGDAMVAVRPDLAAVFIVGDSTPGGTFSRAYHGFSRFLFGGVEGDPRRLIALFLETAWRLEESTGRASLVELDPLFDPNGDVALALDRARFDAVRNLGAGPFYVSKVSEIDERQRQTLIASAATLASPALKSPRRGGAISLSLNVPFGGPPAK